MFICVNGASGAERNRELIKGNLTEPLDARLISDKKVWDIYDLNKWEFFKDKMTDKLKKGLPIYKITSGGSHIGVSNPSDQLICQLVNALDFSLWDQFPELERYAIKAVREIISDKEQQSEKLKWLFECSNGLFNKTWDAWA